MQSLPRNSRTLVIGSIITALLVASLVIYRGVIVPASSKRAKIADLNAEIRSFSNQLDMIDGVKTDLANLGARSVAADANLATVRYQEWLLALGKKLKLTDIAVRPGRPVRCGKIGQRIPVTVQADMTQQQLGRLLDHIDQSRGLHRISLVCVEPKQAGNTSLRHKTTVQIDALALFDAIPDSDLLTTEDPIDRLATRFATRELFQPLVEKPVVAVVQKPAPVPVKIVQPKPALPTKHVSINVLAGVRFLATFAEDGDWQAWFVDTKTKQEYVVDTKHPTFRVGNELCEVREIGRDYILLDVAGKSRRVDLGDGITAPQSDNSL